MSAAFKRALEDQFRRYWWLWLLLALFQVSFAAAAIFGRPDSPVPTGALMISFGGITGAAWLRTLCTLPLSRMEVGRLRWWGISGIPLVVLTVAALLPLLAVPFIGREPSMSSVFPLLGRTWGALGLSMLMADLMFIHLGSSQSRQAVNLVGFLITLGAWLVLVVPSLATFLNVGFLINLMPTLTVLGIVIGIHRFIRADRYVLKRPITSAPAKAASATTRSGTSGWLSIVKPQTFVIATWIGMFIGSFRLLSNGSGIPQSVLALMLVFMMTVMGFSQPMIWMSAARTFRTLPLTAGQLALVFLILIPLPGVAIAALCFAIAVMPPGWMLSSLTFLVSVGAVGIPLTLRFGNHPVAALLGVTAGLIAFLIFFLWTAKVFAITSIDVTSPASVAIQLALGAIVVGASWLWTRYELTNGTRAYRPRANQFSAFGGGMQPQ